MSQQENRMSRREFLRIGSSTALASVASLAIPGLEYPIQINTESPSGIPQIIQYKPESSISEIFKLLSLLKHQSPVDMSKDKDVLNPTETIVPYQFGPNGVSIAWFDAPPGAESYNAQINFTDYLNPDKGIVLTGVTNDFEWYGENMLLNLTYNFRGTYYEIQGGVTNPRTSLCSAIFPDYTYTRPVEESLSWDWRYNNFLPAVEKS